MPLSDLQIALGMMVTTQAATHRSADAPNFNNLRLTAAERGWLAQLPDTSGFNVTCYIQRWWRETKLSWTTRLTLAALGPERADAALKDYLEAGPCTSLFFTPEALGFLDFVPGVLWFALKVLIFLYFYLWFRASWPRYRYAQLMKVGWQYLMPIAIANVIVTAILVLVLGT